MIEILALVREQVASSLRRAAGAAMFALIVALFVLFAVAGLFGALFFWVERDHGPLGASLVCAGVALVLAALFALPLLFRPRRPPPPPPRPADGMLPQILTLMTKSTQNLTPRQLALAAAAVGVALLLSSRRGGKK